MEIFKPELTQSDKTEFVKQVEHEYKLIGRIPYKRGQTLFSFNVETGELHPTEITTKQELVIKRGQAMTVTKRSVMREKNCIYLYALNMKNAERKIIKMLNEIKNKQH